MFWVNPINVLEYIPISLPSEVLLSEIVGSGAVFQQTPLAVIDPPFYVVIIPPDTEDVCVIEVIAVVVKTGTAIWFVINET